MTNKTLGEKKIDYQTDEQFCKYCPCYTEEDVKEAVMQFKRVLIALNIDQPDSNYLLNRMIEIFGSELCDDDGEKDE